MPKDYDIVKALGRIEEELISSMFRNMKRHKEWENEEGFQWSMWQAEQLKYLEKYKQLNQKKYGKQFAKINQRIEALIKDAREAGGMEQEIEILEAIQKGFKPGKKMTQEASAEFFRLNTRKLEALIRATTEDFQKAEQAMLRMANDQYRQIIFDAQVYANSGAATYETAVDMASKDFLARGINCIQYANGARHVIQDYADMAIRTASKRAKFVGEGEKRAERGIHTVIMNKRGNPCPKCLPFCGKVLIDDVWSGGEKSDGPYPLMSEAMAAGLYHPRCKDGHATFFPEMDKKPENVYTEAEIEEIKQEYTFEQKRVVAKRNFEKYDRMAEHSLDPENKEKYRLRAESWKAEYAKYYRQANNTGPDKEQFGRYKSVLRELCPKSFEGFRDLKYNNPEGWADMKRKYRILNQYKVDNGSMTASEILKMDEEIISEKRKNFTRRRRKQGNIAGAKVDGSDSYYIAHSRISAADSRDYLGEATLVGLKEERRYRYVDVPRKDGTLREKTFEDTEAKLFEYFADLYEKKPFKRIDMLSERGMCDSCRGIMEQFMEEHPGVKVNVVSNKRVEGDVWKHRLQNKG